MIRTAVWFFSFFAVLPITVPFLKKNMVFLIFCRITDHRPVFTEGEKNRNAKALPLRTRYRL
ncbi:hypothetical protein [Exiguobacterium profundum]|uniref:hypothetical protein n=1 Tax=Exiguobacterium profundum TaxID=307643 RepID=UPI000AFB7560|nr:hypothetical protein [Exiguobacterium profundum]